MVSFRALQPFSGSRLENKSFGHGDNAHLTRKTDTSQYCLGLDRTMGEPPLPPFLSGKKLN
jgi:hypothetical protein